MNNIEYTIEGMSEAIHYIRENWLTTKSPVWTGDVHEFMANVIDERVSFFEVMHVLVAISKGDHIEELTQVFVDKDPSGGIERVSVGKGF